MPAKPKPKPQFNWDLAKQLFLSGTLRDVDIIKAIGCSKSAFCQQRSDGNWVEQRDGQEVEIAKSINQLISNSRFKWYAQTVQLFLRLSDAMDRLSIQGNLKSIEAWQRVMEKHTATGRTLFALDSVTKSSPNTLISVQVGSNPNLPPKGVVTELLSENLSTVPNQS